MQSTVEDLMLLAGAGRAALMSTVQEREFVFGNGFWLLQDVGVKTRDDAIFSTELNPQKLLLPKTGFSLHVFADLKADIEAIEHHFLRQGFTVSPRNYVIDHDLTALNIQTPKWQCRRVQDTVLLEQLNRLEGRVLASAADLTSGKVHVFAAFDGLRPVSWVCGCPLNTTATWDDDLFTLPKYRGQGIAVELMNAIHGFESEAGFERSYSFSTQTLFPYHQKHGYRKLAWKLRFVPKTSWWQQGLQKLRRWR